jgi:hypothetical protein
VAIESAAFRERSRRVFGQSVGWEMGAGILWSVMFGNGGVVTGQILEEGEQLKHDLRQRFAGQPRSFADAVIRIAHALLIAEAEAEGDAEFAKFADQAIAKLSGGAVEPPRL